MVLLKCPTGCPQSGPRLRCGISNAHQIHAGDLNFIGCAIVVFSLSVYFDFRALLNSAESISNFRFILIYVA